MLRVKVGAGSSDTSSMADAAVAEQQPRYPVEKIAGVYRSTCSCGWCSTFFRTNADALGELVRHRYEQHG